MRIHELNYELDRCVSTAITILDRLAPELSDDRPSAITGPAAASIAVGLLTEHTIVATDCSTSITGQGEPLVFADEEAAHTVRCILHLVHSILGAAGLIDQGDARTIRLVSTDDLPPSAGFDRGYVLVETLDHGGPRDLTPDMGLIAAEIAALAAGVRL